MTNLAVSCTDIDNPMVPLEPSTVIVEEGRHVEKTSSALGGTSVAARDERAVTEKTRFTLIACSYIMTEPVPSDAAGGVNVIPRFERPIGRKSFQPLPPSKDSTSVRSGVPCV